MNTTINPSYWETTHQYRRRHVVIVGSGIIGLLSAYRLARARPDWSVLVVDRGSIPAGASTRSAGFACFGSPSELWSDAQTMGWDAVAELVEKRWSGIALLRQIVGDAQLKLEMCGGFEVFNESNESLYHPSLEAVEWANTHLRFMGSTPYEPCDIVQLQRMGMRGFRQAIACKPEGALNPGHMMQSLQKMCQEAGVEFLFGLPVHGLEEDINSVTLHCGKVHIETDLVLLATNAFTNQLLPSATVRPARNVVLITSPIPNNPLRGVFHYDMGYVYFRHVDNRILIGGARNHFGEREFVSDFDEPSDIALHLEQMLREHIASDIGVQIEQTWSGIIAVGGIGKGPIVQWESSRIFAAYRMGGMGISIGAWVANQAAEALMQH